MANKPLFNANDPVYQPVPPRKSVTTSVRPMPKPTKVSAKKRALLCGITYKGNKRSIEGSIDNVKLMKGFLNKRGFDDSSVILLTEEQRDKSKIPTKKNILTALHGLVKGCQSGDSLVFYYSGHGSRVQDRNGDEVDGYRDALVPVDYETEGRILDDDINRIIVKPLTRGVTLHAIIDTCFSGTFLDLPYVCNINSQGGHKWMDRQRHIRKGTNEGRAISISACDHNQNSGEAAVFAGRPTGALTRSFVKTLEKDQLPFYGRLLIAMHEIIRKAQVGPTETTAAPQEPKLSASEKFDIDTEPCII